MEEKILGSLTLAAMIRTDEGASLAEDLAKIHKLLDSAANSDLAQGSMNDGHQVARFMHSSGFCELKDENKDKIALRRDETCTESTSESVVVQSKHYDEPYSVVPRVV